MPSIGSAVLGSTAPSAVPPNARLTITGVSTTITSTRRYCMKATSRSSPPSSRAIATMPEAPPATIPSDAVAGSTPVTRASSSPAAIVSASVATLTSSTGSHVCWSAPSCPESR